MTTAIFKKSGSSTFDVDAAARACFLKMTPRRWRIVRLFDALLLPLVRLTARVRRKRQRGAEPVDQILVIEYWNIGDIVNLLPFLRNLRAAYPEAHISLLANPGMRTLLEDQSLVDEIIPFVTPWSANFRRFQKYNPLSLSWIRLAKAILALRQRKFDLILTGRMDVRDNFTSWLIGAKQRVGYGFAGGASLLTDVVSPNLSRPHRSQIWLQLLRHLGHPVSNELPQLHLSEAERAFADKFLAQNRLDAAVLLIGVHPGARIATRRWGEDNFASVASRIESELNARILWFSDPSAKDSAESLPSSWIRISLPFREFLAVLARCNLLVCNDSGPMHLATALAVPVVAVFGPQQPEWFGPIGPNNRVVLRPEFWCRPCSDYCIFDQPYCLRTITPDQVNSAIQAILPVPPIIVHHADSKSSTSRFLQPSR
jgi:heptosyltransferase-2